MIALGLKDQTKREDHITIDEVTNWLFLRDWGKTQLL